MSSDPLLNGKEIDKALKDGLTSASEAFVAKFLNNDVPLVLPHGPLKDFGLAATSCEVGKLRDELIVSAQRLRDDTWAQVSEGIRLKDLQRSAGAERSKGVKMATEKKMNPPNNGGDFLRKQKSDTLRRIKDAKDKPMLLEAKAIELQKERATFIAERKRLLANRKEMNQTRRKLLATIAKVFALYAPGGAKDKTRAKTEAALLEEIKNFPSWRLEEIERTRNAWIEENERLKDGWSVEKVEIQESMVVDHEEWERWMMQAQECRHWFVRTSARDPQDLPDVDSLLQLVEITKRWDQEEKKRKKRRNAVVKTSNTELSSEGGSVPEAKKEEEEEEQDKEKDEEKKAEIQEEPEMEKEEEKKEIHVEPETEKEDKEEIQEETEMEKETSTELDTGPKESLHPETRQAVVYNGIKSYLQSNELQQLFQENRQLEREYNETLGWKKEEEESVYNALHEVLDAPSKLRAEYQKVLQDVRDVNKNLSILRKRSLQVLENCRNKVLTHVTKLHFMRRNIAQKEREFGIIANGVMHTNIQRAESAELRRKILSDRVPVLEQRIEANKRLAANLSANFAEVHALTQWNVDRLMRFADRGSVTLLLQAVDKHVMNIEQHAAERDILP